MRLLLITLAGILALVAADEGSLPVVWHEDIGDLPEEFDARSKWPRCDTIGKIYDQGSCRSSWVRREYSDPF